MLQVLSRIFNSFIKNKSIGNHWWDLQLNVCSISSIQNYRYRRNPKSWIAFVCFLTVIKRGNKINHVCFWIVQLLYALWNIDMLIFRSRARIWNYKNQIRTLKINYINFFNGNGINFTISWHFILNYIKIISKDKKKI